MGVTSLAVVADPRYAEHRAPPGHPECAERLAAVARALEGRAGQWTARGPRPASDEELLRVHPRAHVDTVTAAAQRAPAHFDPDTFVSSRSLDVARLAAGGAIEAARAVARGEVRAALAAIRPPGHHAEATRAMGFCLFNNVAVAVRAVQAEERLERVLVFDWDVHHGNGTQHLFEEDPDVLYVSTHQYPFYPGTGAATEAGRGRGLGATVNVPLPAGSGDAEYVGVLRRVLVPVARRFRPELVFVSCGFDAHADDPLADMEVSGAGFAEMTRIVRRLADDVCDGRLVFVLEGGYAASGLAQGTAALLDGVLASGAPALEPAPAPGAGSRLAEAIERVAAVHRGRFPDLGAA